jgi:hypothetical protein
MVKHDYNNISAPLWNAEHMHSPRENITVKQLFKFIGEWYYNYKLVWGEFDLYHKVPMSGYIPVSSGDNFESYDSSLQSADFFSVNLFEKILNKDCIFEKIMPPTYNYEDFNESSAYKRYMKSPDSMFRIVSEHFILSRESTDTNKVWSLDTKMVNNKSPQQRLVLSLIVTLTGNYVLLDLYKRNKQFRNFVDRFSETTDFYFRFANHSRVLVTTTGEINFDDEVIIFKYGLGAKESVIIDYNKVGSNNLKFSYKHLDELFGKNRKEMLTEEDLQLYSICNEGRKPFIYDWEFVV